MTLIIETPHVYNVSTELATMVGGTVVTVFGANFETGASCTFGTAASTSATVLTSSFVLCTSPAFTDTTTVVEVTNNGVDFTDDGVSLTFYGMNSDNRTLCNSVYTLFVYLKCCSLYVFYSGVISPILCQLEKPVSLLVCKLIMRRPCHYQLLHTNTRTAFWRNCDHSIWLRLPADR